MGIVRRSLGSERSLVLWAAGIFTLALLARALWAAYASAEPAGVGDALTYDYAARELAAGHGYVSVWSREETALYPPGFPAFLGGIYKAFGTDFHHGEAANVLLGALTCVAVFLLGTALFGRKVGVVSGLTLAVYPNHVFFVPVIMSEVLFTLLLTVALLAAVHAGRQQPPRLPLVLGAGFITGVAALVRSEATMLLLIVPLFWLVTTTDRRTALRGAALYAITALAVIFPWSLRNYTVMDSPIFISSNVGANVYLGRWDNLPDRIDATAALMEPHEDLTSKQFEVKQSEDGWREGLRLIVTKPWRELRMAPTKFRSLYASDTDAVHQIEVSRQAGDAGRPARPLPSFLRPLSNAVYFLVLGLAIGGAAIAVSRRQAGVWLIGSLVVVWTLGQMVMLSGTRFHFPIIPAFCLLGSLAIVAAWEGVKSVLVRRETGRPVSALAGAR